MCGLFGMINWKQVKPYPQEQVETLLKSLAAFSSERGVDATGLTIVHRKGRWEKEFKRAQPSYEEIRRKEWTNTVNRIRYDTPFILGHVRKASRGANTDNNAHPFVFFNDFGRLVGAHNGTITNHSEFAKETKYDVDSARLFYELASYDCSEWESILKRISGTFALTWTRAGRFYMVRNDTSPLVLTYVEAIESWVYASTEHILQSALSFAGLTSKTIDTVAPNVLHEFFPEESTRTTIPMELSKPSKSSWDSVTGAVHQPYKGAYSYSSYAEAVISKCEACGEEFRQYTTSYKCCSKCWSKESATLKNRIARFAGI